MKNKTNVSTTGRIEYQNAVGPNNWNVHPAFHYDGTSTTGTQLAGIWVAKYEMSIEIDGINKHLNITTGDKLTSESIKAVSKPGVPSWKYLATSTAFLNGLNYDTNSLNNATLDSHLMKDSEWGAVAYLAHSKYGRNGTEITISGMYYTGGTENATATTNVLQSTTGNCYGIYDISGYHFEIVAAYKAEESITDTNGAELVNAEAKYKDVYDASGVTEGSTTTDYGKIGGQYAYGNAMYETSLGTKISSGYNEAGWFSDYSIFGKSTSIFVHRGGTSNIITDAGIFGFACGEDNRAGRDWRVVLWNK